MIGSVTNNARDYLDFVGFDKELPVLIEALRHDMGRGKPLTNCSRSFTNLHKNAMRVFSSLLEDKSLSINI